MSSSSHRIDGAIRSPAARTSTIHGCSWRPSRIARHAARSRARLAGARAVRVGIVDGDVEPALARALAMAVVAVGAEHQDARAVAELRVRDRAVVRVLVDDDLAEVEGRLQELDGGLRVSVAK